MRKLAILAIATTLATAYAGADASERGHHRHAADHHKSLSAKAGKTDQAQPAERPVTHVPVPPDTFRA